MPPHVYTGSYMYIYVYIWTCCLSILSSSEKRRTLILKKHHLWHTHFRWSQPSVFSPSDLPPRDLWEVLRAVIHPMKFTSRKSWHGSYVQRSHLPSKHHETNDCHSPGCWCNKKLKEAATKKTLNGWLNNLLFVVLRSLVLFGLDVMFDEFWRSMKSTILQTPSLWLP